MAGTPFDWKSLITPAVALGSKAIGDIVAPSAELQSVRNQQQQNQFSDAMALKRMAQANAVRRTTMPGLYTNLGYAPGKARQMGADYQTEIATPSGVSSSYLGAGGSSSGGSGAGKAALGLGIGMAPAAIGALGKSSAAKGLGSVLGKIAPIAIPAAAIGLGAYIWKKTQAHPTADKWVQGAQAPFDANWKAISDSGMPPEQKQQAMNQSAQNYLTSLVEFAGQGGHNAEVARNAARTFRQYYGDPAKYGVQVPF